MVNNIRNATALWKYISGSVDDDGAVNPGAFGELSNIDENGQWHTEPRSLLVHSKVGGADVVPDPLKKMLVQTAGLGSKSDAEAAVREMLNTVGKPDRPGAQIRCVVSVSMLTEGWDARTVTHIVGFRAFSTQLLCEQVTGRALRRTSYDALREPDDQCRRLLEAEYADVVGIPFEFMPDLDQPEPAPRAPKPRTRVHTVNRRRQFRVGWPQALEYTRTAPQGRFDLDPSKVNDWKPPPSDTATMTVVEGAAGESQIIASVPEEMRDRTALLKVAARLVEGVASPEGVAAGQGRASLFRSAVKAVDQWASHPRVDLKDLKPLLADSSLLRTAIEAILDACDFHTDESARRARLASPSILDTSRVDFETTLAHITTTTKSELSHAACHSRLELKTASALERDKRVVRWVRNFQLGWTIPYWRGSAWARYEPDFIAVLDNGVNLIIECKGVWDDKATQTAEFTKQHWIPSIAGTTELPDPLRRWAYAVIDDPKSTRYQLDLAIKQAQKRHP